ncbi:MAG: ATP-binding protein [Cyanobacteria bacterium]|nr:ATP-binding protein [Cyanobacteriota bacterium]
MATTRAKSVVQERRDYSRWVANETLEDYALRYAPQSFRRWPELLVANTALGGISFLALEAIGGSLAINYGFANSFWAIVVVGGLIFLAGVPIAYYAAKYNIDMDLLTRGAGFGYLGSTITSLIYASFTFIFFALEAAIMAQALELYFHLPLWLGYILCSLLIIPLVFYGVTLINQLQLWTQPLWLILMVSPYIFVLHREPQAFDHWLHFAGNSPSGAAFDPLLFGMAATVSFSLIAQLGEQVDYLRFLPERRPENRRRWWLAVLMAGPGWIVLGVAKQLGGAFLASLVLSHGLTIARAREPVQMYLAGFSDMFSDPSLVLAVGTLFVVVSQIKINVTNAYAGSLAWSNFFSRLTHSHPGRVVWLVFNVLIALVLMELGVFETLDLVLGLYSNVAIAWVGALVSDLVINKPLKLSPSYIEFKRAYLYNINPVGFGSTAIASAVAILAFVGVWGEWARAYCAFLALGIAFVLAPAIAWITKGKYYLARENTVRLAFGPEDSDAESGGDAIATDGNGEVIIAPQASSPWINSQTLKMGWIGQNIPSSSRQKAAPWGNENGPLGPWALSQDQGQNTAPTLLTCIICEGAYETADMAHCSVYGGAICSLCCTLDSHCHDRCKDPLDREPETNWRRRLSVALFADKLAPYLGARIIHFALIFGLLSGVVGAIVGLVYYFAVVQAVDLDAATAARMGELFGLLYALLSLVVCGGAGWFVLSEESRERAEDELDRQNAQLQAEVRDRERAEAALQALTRSLEQRVEQRTAELSEALATLRQAQTQLVQTEKMSSLGQLVAGVAHEINNPVNFIHGNLDHAATYVGQLLELIDAYQEILPEPPLEIEALCEDIELDFLREDLIKILNSMRVGTDRIRQIVLSLRVFSRVDESAVKAVDLHEGIESTLLILGNRLKANGQRSAIAVQRHYGDLPLVECYAGQLNQVFMNLLANAIDAFDELNQGQAGEDPICWLPKIDIRTQRVGNDQVQIAIADNGPGIPLEIQSKLFDAFFTTKGVGKGTGLGLSIAYQIVTDKHGGHLSCESKPGHGTQFILRIPIRAQMQDSAMAIASPARRVLT